MAVVCDTGGVYALYDADDAHHAAVMPTTFACRANLPLRHFRPAAPLDLGPVSGYRVSCDQNLAARQLAGRFAGRDDTALRKGGLVNSG